MFRRVRVPLLRDTPGRRAYCLSGAGRRATRQQAKATRGEPTWPAAGGKSVVPLLGVSEHC